MTPRTILYTGKGGVGKTSVAAATARRCAAGGRAHAGALDRPAALARRRRSRPRSARSRRRSRDGLWGQQVQAQEEMERHWSACPEWLGELLVERGVDRIAAEELTVPPGLDELFSLLQLKRHHERGEWDAVDRRLRADRRDAAAALVPRRRPLVAGEGLPPRAPAPGRRAADRAHGARRLAARARPCSPTSQRLVRQPDRDERDPPRPRARHDPARDEPGPDGRSARRCGRSPT